MFAFSSTDCVVSAEIYIYDELFPFLGELMGDEFEWGWLWQDSAAADSAIVAGGVKKFFNGILFLEKENGACIVVQIWCLLIFTNGANSRSLQDKSGWSQWPHGLRRGSAAARPLGLWVQIPPGAWMSVVCVVYCQVEVSATSWSLVQRSPTDCGASCVI